jgi:hypothetical protein
MSFLSTFLIAFLIQAVFLLIALATGLGDGVVYLIYAAPYILVDAIFVRLPKQVGDGFLTLYFLLCIPAAAYSAAYAGIKSWIRRRSTPQGAKLE